MNTSIPHLSIPTSIYVYTSPINDSTYSLYAFHLNVSECNSKHSVYMSCIGPKYHQSYLQKYEHRIGFIAVEANPQF